MKPDELKLRISGFLNNMIDTYYGNPMVGEKLLNYTLKIIVKNNIGKLDSVLCLFQDADGNIDAHAIINDYVQQMGNEQVCFDLRDYVGENNIFIKSILPDKKLVITASDISKILY